MQGFWKQFAAMSLLAVNLRKRAEALGLSNAEVARRSGVPERTYGNYVLGRTEPNLDTLLAIAKALDISIDALLNSRAAALGPEPLMDRLQSAARAMSHDDLEILAVQAEALVSLRNRRR